MTTVADQLVKAKTHAALDAIAKAYGLSEPTTARGVLIYNTLPQRRLRLLRHAQVKGIAQ